MFVASPTNWKNVHTVPPLIVPALAASLTAMSTRFDAVVVHVALVHGTSMMVRIQRAVNRS